MHIFIGEVLISKCVDVNCMAECNIKKRCETENQIELIIRRRIIKPNLFCMINRRTMNGVNKKRAHMNREKNILKRNFDKISLFNMKIEMNNKNYWISII